MTPLTSLVMVSSKKNATLIEMNDIEKDIKQPEQEINDKFGECRLEEIKVGLMHVKKLL